MIEGLLFDKDGTLLDIEATWGPWAVGALRELAGGDRSLAGRMGAAVGIDARTGAFDPDGPAVAGTLGEQALLLGPLAGREARDIEAWLRRSAMDAVPLMLADRAFFDGLSGYALGVATNDGEAAALAQLSRGGLGGVFPFVAGYDSGFGGKPGPGMIHAFADHAGLETRQVAMIGDSEHDLNAARAAGAVAVAVLSGPIGRARLEPLADAVLEDIRALPAWLGANATRWVGSGGPAAPPRASGSGAAEAT